MHILLRVFVEIGIYLIHIEQKTSWYLFFWDTVYFVTITTLPLSVSSLSTSICSGV